MGEVVIESQQFVNLLAPVQKQNVLLADRYTCFQHLDLFLLFFDLFMFYVPV